MNYKIALIRGDGIGPEVVGEAVQVMEAVGKKFGHSFTFEDILMGGCATDAVGVSYPEGTAEKCRACDAVLLGAVGGPKWGSDKPAEQRPETALLAIRKDLGLYANLRPAALRPAMADACPLKKETAEKGIDLMMVRELTGGIYFGQRERYDTPDRGVECADRMAYSEQEIERIGRRAGRLQNEPFVHHQTILVPLVVVLLHQRVTARQLCSNRCRKRCQRIGHIVCFMVLLAHQHVSQMRFTKSKEAQAGITQSAFCNIFMLNTVLALVIRVVNSQ